jgi:hypothetical protein
MTTANRDVQALLDDLLPFAKQMLADYGEFHPYGGFMRPDGSIVHVGATDLATDTPRGEDLLRLLRDDVRRRAKRKEIRAIALISNMRVTHPGDQTATDAIRVRVEQIDTYSAHVFLPYRFAEEGRLGFGLQFAQEEPTVFSRGRSS